MKRTIHWLSILLLSALQLGCATSSSQQAPLAPGGTNSELASVNTQLGLGYLRNGQVRQAWERLNAALQADPDYATANNGIALVYDRLNEPEKAEQHFKRAIELNPSDSAAQTNYGAFLCQRGRIDEGEKYFLKAVENPLYDKPAMAYTNAGCVGRRGLFPIRAARRSALRGGAAEHGGAESGQPAVPERTRLHAALRRGEQAQFPLAVDRHSYRRKARRQGRRFQPRDVAESQLPGLAGNSDAARIGDAVTTNDAAIRVVSESGDEVGPGERLREARQAAQLSVAEVAARLRLRPQVLDRLENDDYEQLHGPTFVRGYLSSYARLLDLPEGPILEAYERHGYGPPALVPELLRRPEVHISDFPVRMVTYVIAGLLVILVVLWWQSRQPEPGALERADSAAESVQQTSGPPATGDSSAEAESPPASPAGPPPEDDTASVAPSLETAGPAVADTASETIAESDARQPQVAMLDQQSTGSEAVHVDAPAPPSDGTPSDAPPSDGTSTAMAAEPVGEATSPTERDATATEAASSADGAATTAAAGVEEQVAPAPPPTPLPGSDVLAIRLATESWVEIYDRGGGRLYYSLARESSEVIVRGAGPMRVLLGDVEGAAVSYNGEPFDLSRYQGRGVARFTVGEASGTTMPGSPAPTAAQEPVTRETPEPAAEQDGDTVADAGAALITPGAEPATAALAPAAELAPRAALPAPAGGTPQSGMRGTRPDP